ncbi:MAG: hypothetical protein R2713_15755 [Ilumatobacteraceae bacterium]
MAVFRSHEEIGLTVETWGDRTAAPTAAELRDSETSARPATRLAALIAIVEQLTGRR